MTALAPLELATGLVWGQGAPVMLPRRAAGVAAALESAVLPALRRTPCVVSFSGGRDSSAVLAVATGIARRHGLPDPVPATVRAPRAQAAEESSWQELVVAHLGLEDWVRIEVDEELEAIGPVARAALVRHGLLWPFNAHFHAPMLETARGGALLTGVGGDELFVAASCPRASGVLRGRVRPEPRDLRSVAFHAAPRPLRSWWDAREPVPFEWLTPAARRAAARELARDSAARPRSLGARMRHVRSSRVLDAGTASLERLAGAAGAEISHPLLAPAVWAGVRDAAPRSGFRGRTQGMRVVFGPLLPDALLARRDKASFDEVFYASAARAFAREWDGRGIPDALVDADALRAHWLAPAPRAQSFLLLQAAWLASTGDGGHEPLHGLAEDVPAVGPAHAPDRQ